MILYLFILSVIQFVTSEHYWLQPDGIARGSADGSDRSSPLESVSACMAVIGAGDVVTIVNGVYFVTLEVTKSGTNSDRLVFRAETGASLMDVGQRESACVWFAL